jgi:hypothetical protein
METFEKLGLYETLKTDVAKLQKIWHLYVVTLSGTFRCSRFLGPCEIAANNFKILIDPSIVDVSLKNRIAQKSDCSPIDSPS